jgi:mRNA-degrading endonuclease toxin of MazEF toxin-antitoxin module
MRPPFVFHNNNLSIWSHLWGQVYGKSDWYSRPVLVVRKFNRHLAFVAPLTTQTKDNPYYVPCTFQGKGQCVLISQLRAVYSGRFYKKIGTLDEDDFYHTVGKIQDLFPKKNYSPTGKVGAGR